MKEQFKKELKEKIKPGVKASDLKKLKRSKSADDIPSAPASVPLAKTQSNPPNQLLTDQLKEKQQEIEKLREQLETTNTELKSLQETHSSVLDDNLSLKHQSLKD